MDSFLDRVRRATPFRSQEARTALLMFAYSFLAMTSYNILKPLTRSKFISALGADNLPYVQLAAGLLIGVLMHVYGIAIQRLPRRHVIPVTQAGIAALLVVFWGLFKIDAAWVTVAFYVLGLILGVLLISQFWTLANDIYDARQAKRLFGFIGGGASLGGASGAAITAFVVNEVGSNNLLLVSAAVLTACAAIVVVIVRRHEVTRAGAVEEERGVGGREAIRLLVESRQLQILALVIGFAAAGAVVVEQQLNMAAEATRGNLDSDSIAQFLAQVSVYLSLAGFALQIFLTSHIHRSFGIAVALLVLPVTLGASASLILATGALWAVAGARVMDATLRYTLDKTTREVLFLPLPTELKYRAKPFLDVTMDRFSKAAGALLVLVLIKPWGLGLDWRRLSYASLTMMAVWIIVALVARREYLASFRASINTQAIAPGSIRTRVADGATIEALVEELSNPDASAAVYAIDMLEALDKRHLISPLLLYHESARVRVRALAAFDATRPDIALRWRDRVEQIVHDADVDVRAAALRALAALAHEEASVTVRRYIDDPEPRVAAAAATVLAQSADMADVATAETTVLRLAADDRDSGATGRMAAAEALARMHHSRFRPLLLPLLYDDDVLVVRSAIRSARALGASDGLFLPGLVSLLGHRVLKEEAREALVGYGPAILPALSHVLLDTREEAWVRRHVPATMAHLPSQATLDALTAALDDPDGFLRHKVITAAERVGRGRHDLVMPKAAFEKAVMRESARYCNHLSLRYSLRLHPQAETSLLQRALDDKLTRTLDRLFRLLGLLHGEDLGAVRQAIEHGDPRRRASALEYLDNVLGSPVRKRVLPLLDDASMADKVRHANHILGTRARGVDDALAQLVHDDDHVVAATAVQFVAEQGIWALVSDLEFQASKTSRERRWVAEAAAWALARQRLAGAEPEAGSLRVVELVARLRTIAMLSFVWVDELFRLAEAGQETHYAAGRTLLAAASRPDVHLLLDGTVRVGTNTDARDVTAPAVLGAGDVLRGAPVADEVEAATRVVSLRIPAADFLTMVSDNALLAQGLFRMLLAPLEHAGPQTDEHMLPAGLDAVSRPGPLDTATALRRHPIFAHANASQLRALVAAAREVPLSPGQVVFEAYEPSSCLLVLEGAVTLESDHDPRQTAHRGWVLGVAATLAGAPWRRRAVAEHAGRALVIGRDDLFDVLTDHVDLLQSLFGATWEHHRLDEAKSPSPLTVPA